MDDCPDRHGYFDMEMLYKNTDGIAGFIENGNLMQIYFQFDDPSTDAFYDTFVISGSLTKFEDTPSEWYIEQIKVNGDIDEIGEPNFSLKESNPDIELYNEVASEVNTFEPTIWSMKVVYDEYNDEQVLTYMYL